MEAIIICDDVSSDIWYLPYSFARMVILLKQTNEIYDKNDQSIPFQTLNESYENLKKEDSHRIVRIAIFIMMILKLPSR